jgi:hypothetical protein
MILADTVTPIRESEKGTAGAVARVYLLGGSHSVIGLSLARYTRALVVKETYI